MLFFLMRKKYWRGRHMKEVFKQLIIDFHKKDIPLPTWRDCSSLSLPSGINKAFTLIGMRRSGKTWTLFQKMHQLLKEGIARSTSTLRMTALQEQTQKTWRGFWRGIMSYIPLEEMKKTSIYFSMRFTRSPDGKSSSDASSIANHTEYSSPGHLPRCSAKRLRHRYEVEH